MHYVFDTAVAADFSILESQKEFVRRYQQHSEEEPALPMLTSACPGERPGPAAAPLCARGTISHYFSPFLTSLPWGQACRWVRSEVTTLGALDLEGVESWWGSPQVHSRAPHLTQPLPGAHQPPPTPNMAWYLLHPGS